MREANSVRPCREVPVTLSDRTVDEVEAKDSLSKMIFAAHFGARTWHRRRSPRATVAGGWPAGRLAPSGEIARLAAD